MSLAALVATIIFALAIGTHYSQFYGWITLGTGIFVVGVLYQIEQFLERKGWA